MRKFLLLLAALLIAGGVTVSFSVQFGTNAPLPPVIQDPPIPEAAPVESLPISDPPPDVQGPEGWLGPESLKVTAAWTESLPPFELTVDGQPVWQDNHTTRVVQWDDQAALAGGQLPPNIAQQIGDCTAHGAKNATERMQGAAGSRGPPTEFKRISAMWLYGAGRVWIANRQFGRGDGCSGAAIAQAARDFGLLPEDTPGLPAYDGNICRQWGWNGPPEQFKAIAAQHRVKTVSLLRSAAEVRDAVCNRFGVTIASSWGTSNRAMRVQDGRIVAPRSGKWLHQMCVDGYDGSSPSGKKYFHITNSWGPDAHPAPIDGSPPGGFWVEESEITWIVQTGRDTWAYSDFEGFPAQLDVSPLRPKR